MVVHLEALAGFEQGDFVKAENKFLEASAASKDAKSSDIATYNVAPDRSIRR